MGEVVPLREREIPFDGGCPICWRCLILNVGRTHWGVCRTHRVKWEIGSNLYSGWHYENEDIWASNAETLAKYRLIKPVFPERICSTVIEDDSDIPF